MHCFTQDTSPSQSFFCNVWVNGISKLSLFSLKASGSSQTPSVPGYGMLRVDSHFGSVLQGECPDLMMPPGTCRPPCLCQVLFACATREHLLKCLRKPLDGTGVQLGTSEGSGVPPLWVWGFTVMAHHTSAQTVELLSVWFTVLPQKALFEEGF